MMHITSSTKNLRDYYVIFPSAYLPGGKHELAVEWGAEKEAPFVRSARAWRQGYVDCGRERLPCI